MLERHNVMRMDAWFLVLGLSGVTSVQQTFWLVSLITHPQWCFKVSWNRWIWAIKAGNICNHFFSVQFLADAWALAWLLVCKFTMISCKCWPCIFDDVPACGNCRYMEWRFRKSLLMATLQHLTYKILQVILDNYWSKDISSHGWYISTKVVVPKMSTMFHLAHKKYRSCSCFLMFFCI